MPEIIADPLLPSCYQLSLKPGIPESQQLGPDPFLPRGRDARGRFATGSSGNPRGRPRGMPIPGGACPTSSPGHRALRGCRICSTASLICCAPRGATAAAAARFDRPGGASRDRSRAVADGRGLPAGADYRSGGHWARRDRARRGRAHRAAGACPATR
jgi:hypothetical protein